MLLDVGNDSFDQTNRYLSCYGCRITFGGDRNCIAEHLLNDLILPLTLAKGTSTIICQTLSLHAQVGSINISTFKLTIDY